MMKCSAFIATSLDGFIARKDGGIDWLTGDGQPQEGEDYGYQAFFDSVDALVMGRNTYELVLTFKQWPYGEKRVFVLSSGSPKIPAEQSKSVAILSGSPSEVVQRLRKRGVRHAYVDGGKTIQGFLRAGLLDEITITRIPIMIGDGIPLFGTLPHDVKLEHIQTKAYERGLVQTKYRLHRMAQAKTRK